MASSLTVGCGSEPAAEASVPTPVVENPAAVEAALDEVIPSRPLVQSLTATPKAALGKSTATVFELTLTPDRSQNEQFRGGTLTLTPDGVQQLLFRDDGQGGDATARDLRFTASGTFDYDALRAEQDRIRAVQARTPTQPLTQTFFEGRQVVRTATITPLPASVFQVGTPIPIQPVGLASQVDPARSLIIRDPGVINDSTRTWDPCSGTGNPNGKWTFNYLMTEMANQPYTGVAPSTLVREWLRQWETTKVVNGFPIPARTAITTKLINPWPKVGSTSTLDLTRSPMKLLAIVNRIDLAGSNPAYGSGRTGEGRFIFAAVERNGTSCYTVPFLVILEYGVDKPDCISTKAYAQQWQALSSLTPGTAAYNSALEALTEQFAKRDLSPRKPNRSAINQVRTNEEWLTRPWELREFHLWDTMVDPAPFASPGPIAKLLNTHTVAQTPDRTTVSSGFPSYVNGNGPSIVAVPATYTAPLVWAASAFRSGRAIVTSPTASPPFWSQPPATIPNRQARHIFSLNTCDGCHGDELRTNFTHVSWTGALSPFLSGPLTVADPADGAPVRTFNEILARQTFLDQLANQSCLTLPFASTSTAVH